MRTKPTLRYIPLLFLAYFAFQLMYIPYSKLSVDEFWFAHHIYQYTHSLPYRDFPPYKTVLGYYLLAIPFYFSHTLLAPLYWIKIEIALLNSVFLYVTYRWLARTFQPQAILATLALIATNQLFLVYSADLRVDMLTSWFCLFSLLFILRQRPVLAGVSLSVAFLISQKALWYFAAINGALGVYWLLAARDWKTIQQAFLFNLTLLLGISLYLFAWASQSSLHEVLRSVFYEAYLQSKIIWYAQDTPIFWEEMLTNGAVFYFLWPMTWLALFIAKGNRETARTRLFIATFSAIMMVLIITYQQSFPYNMVFSVPVFIVLYSDFFSWLKGIFHSQVLLTGRTRQKLFWFTALYDISLSAVIIMLDLPLSNFGFLFLPIMLFYFLTRHQTHYSKSVFKTCALTLIVILAVVYPMIRFALVTVMLDGDYQKSMITTVSKLLDKDEGYVAGIPFIYNKDQPIPGMRNLIGPAIEYLNTGNKNLEPMLLDSLYMTTTTPDAIIRAFESHPVKLFMDGSRIALLPASLLTYLHSHYMHFWGTIYLYAPVVKQDDSHVLLQFEGRYRIVSTKAAHIEIDGRTVAENEILFFNKGLHTIQTDARFRLQWTPNAGLALNPDFANDAWDKMSKYIIL